MRRSKLVQLKTISEIQAKAIELVQKAEESMRQELRKEIERIREENEELKKKIEFHWKWSVLCR
jgi:predicted phage gp36 major capsid-like protein